MLLPMPTKTFFFWHNVTYAGPVLIWLWGQGYPGGVGARPQLMSWSAHGPFTEQTQPAGSWASQRAPTPNMDRLTSMLQEPPWCCQLVFHTSPRGAESGCSPVLLHTLENKMPVLLVSTYTPHCHCSAKTHGIILCSHEQTTVVQDFNYNHAK